MRMLGFLLSYLHWLDSCGGLCLALYYGQSVEEMAAK